jgi:hypothetical protein
MSKLKSVGPHGTCRGHVAAAQLTRLCGAHVFRASKVQNTIHCTGRNGEPPDPCPKVQRRARFRFLAPTLTAHQCGPSPSQGVTNPNQRIVPDYEVNGSLLLRHSGLESHHH